MGVELVLGPSGSGKTDLAIGKLRQHDLLSWCREVRFVVPTAEQKRQVTDHLLNDDSIPGLIGSPVCTFFDFASDIIAEAGLRTSLISDIQKKLTLADVLKTVDLDYFKAASISPGFVEALDQVIGELKISMIEPQELERALQTLKGQLTPQTKAKARELLTLYHRYQQDILVAKLIHDKEGVMWRALQILRDRGLLKSYKLFIFDGFDQFTGVLKDFIRLISEQVPEVMVTLTYEPDRPEVFQWVEPAISFIRSLGSVSERMMPRKECEPTALKTIEREVFSTGQQEHNSDDTLRFLAGGNIRMEAEMVTSEIVRLMRDESISPGRIAVVTRDTDSYYPYLSDAFNRHHIPYNQADRPVMETALARLVSNAVQVCINGWKREHIIPVLKSPFITQDMGTACHVEVKAAQQAVAGIRSAWFEQWGTEDDTLEYRASALKTLAQLDDAISSVDSTVGFAEAVKQFVEGLSRPGDEEQLAKDSAVKRAVYSVLDELKRTEELVGRKIPKNEACSLFLQGIGDAVYRLNGAETGGVEILSAESISGQRYDVVFVVGLLEKVFPRQVREDSFFRDSERRKLNEALGGKFVERLPGQTRERYLFYRTVTSAERRLYLTYPLSDASAADSLPSFYLDEVRKLFRAETIRQDTRDVGEVVLPPWKAENDRDMLEGLVYGIATGEFDDKKLIQCYNEMADKAAIAEVLEAAEDKEAVITDPVILKHAASSRRRFKATELEEYTACPFRHFCNRILGLEIVQDEVTPLNRGNILHDVLYHLFTQLRDKYGWDLVLADLTHEEIYGSIDPLLDSAIEKDAVLVNLPDHLRSIERKKLKDALVKFVQKEVTESPRELVPAYFEVEFGNRPQEDRKQDPSSTPKPLLLNRRDEFVELCGKIDRVDVNPNTKEAVAVDYKLKSAVPRKDLEEGIKLQAPLYALALKELFGLKPVGSIYRGITKNNGDGYKIGEKMTPEEFEERLEICKERVMDLVLRIAASDVAINPGKGACDYCGLDPICRIDSWKRLEMQTEAAKDA